MSSEDIKKVRFQPSDTTASEDQDEDDANWRDGGSPSRSPLKASGKGLGSTIKKLSPVTGAANTDEAKKAYDRLLQQASMSMFEDDDVVVGGGKQEEGGGNSSSSSETPEYYKELSKTTATPNSQMDRLESQQYNLSPPMLRGSVPSSSSAATAASKSSNSVAPMTPVCSSSVNNSAQRDFIAYREAHSTSTSLRSTSISSTVNAGEGHIVNTDLQQQLQGLRQNFVQAKSTELGQGQGLVSAANKQNDVGTSEDMLNGNSEGSRKQDMYVDVDEDVDDLQSSPTAVAILSAHLSSIEAEVSMPLPPSALQSAHAESFEQKTNTYLSPVSVTKSIPIPIANSVSLTGLSIAEGQQRLEYLALFLQNNAEEFSVHFSANNVNKMLEHSTEQSIAAQNVQLSTFSVNAMEAQVLGKHQALLSSGLIGGV